MDTLDHLSVFRQAARLIARTGHRFTSWTQLFRHARVQDDKGRRVVARLEETFGGRLVEVIHRTLSLTERGKRVYTLADEFDRLREVAATDPAETLVLESCPAIDRSAVASGVGVFAAEWPELATVSVRPTSETTPADVRSGTVAFAVELAEPEEPEAEATADCRPIGWRLLAPPGHRTEGEGTDLSGVVSPSERLAYDSRFEATLAPLLRHIGPVQRLTCDSPEAVRQLVRGGVALAVELDFAGSVSSDLTARSLPDLPPFGVRFLLPPRPDRTSEPAQALLAAIRYALRPTERAAVETAVTDSPSTPSHSGRP